MMPDLKEKLLAFHEKYNLIWDEQSILPHRKGKTDYSEIENIIISKAQELIRDINEFIIQSGNIPSQLYRDEVDNIIDGCLKIIKDPYKKIGGRISL